MYTVLAICGLASSHFHKAPPLKSELPCENKTKLMKCIVDHMSYLGLP